MKKLESIKLFQDLQQVSNKYKSLEFKNNAKEIEDNKKLTSLIKFYQSNINQIKERANFISIQAREELKNSNYNDIYKMLLQLNNFANDNYKILKSSNMDIESTSTKAVILTTIDELMLINNSIRNKEYLLDKNTYFYIYEKITINSFMIFLALKDMDIEKLKIDNLSQAILSQIQILSFISI
ncbi:MAG: hypothetical protein RSD47_03155 [Romboutsia sp.]